MSELAKMYQNLALSTELKSLAHGTERLYTTMGMSSYLGDTPENYAWFDRTTGERVLAPWLQFGLLPQYTIDNVVLAEYDPIYSAQYLMPGSSTVFAFPVVSYQPIDPSFASYSFLTLRDGTTLVGSDGNEIIASTASSETIQAGGGSDIVLNSEGQDVISGGAGSDRIVLARSQPDTITDFNPSEDLLFLDAAAYPELAPDAFIERDQFVVGSRATSAAQRFVYNPRTGVLSFDADGSGTGTPEVLANLPTQLSFSHRNLYTIATLDHLVTVQPSAAGGDGNPFSHDELLGTPGNDRLVGSNGNDAIKGGDGSDRISGGGGTDRLWGGAGSDILSGGTARDCFALEKGVGVDRITDFKNGQDKLGLTPGLRFDQLDIVKQGSRTLVSFQNDPLTSLVGIKPSQITAADFVRMPIA